MLDVLTVEGSLAARDGVGGTAPARVVEQGKAARARVAHFRPWAAAASRSLVDVTIEALASRILASEPTAGGARIVLIDGPAGAGKTTLARRLAERLDDAPVVHADDMYEGWSGLPSLHGVLCDRVLVPLARGEEARFARWDWYRGERGNEITVPAAEVVVIEGVGVAQRCARDLASLRDVGGGPGGPAPRTMA
ncbi:AAA family ATPase [Demequina litorisediminis]|uniref:ORC1/DEAH AAA+ ATPase domain-containing protein n=1 Tax=Demequina litorisediminis TaxID=1849022 RepID=A0ABQ6IJN0_9MICO|nr:AAA family ATPase [Demequina litorisediminis]GMA37333.1 hypothetical protein GCM10025876_35370 [Demequina litorisediminis]